MWILFVAMIFASGETQVLQFAGGEGTPHIYNTEDACKTVLAVQEKTFLQEAKAAGLDVVHYEFKCINVVPTPPAKKKLGLKT